MGIFNAKIIMALTGLIMPQVLWASAAVSEPEIFNKIGSASPRVILVGWSHIEGNTAPLNFIRKVRDKYKKVSLLIEVPKEREFSLPTRTCPGDCKDLVQEFFNYDLPVLLADTVEEKCRNHAMTMTILEEHYFSDNLIVLLVGQLHLPSISRLLERANVPHVAFYYKLRSDLFFQIRGMNSRNNRFLKELCPSLENKFVDVLASQN